MCVSAAQRGGGVSSSSCDDILQMKSRDQLQPPSRDRAGACRSQPSSPRLTAPHAFHSMSVDVSSSRPADDLLQYLISSVDDVRGGVTARHRRQMSNNLTVQHDHDRRLTDSRERTPSPCCLSDHSSPRLTSHPHPTLTHR